MITKTNFKDVLKTLGFTAEGKTFQKTIGEADLKVDFSKQSIVYPEDKGLKVNERQTCNFSQSENFVVFECVHRLLDKGYKPEHLELEPRWRVGRGASGGRADILVRDQENNPLLIIECKTAGDEFEKAWDETRQDGGQLFSYAHQDTHTQYLCLYASNFFKNELDYEYKLIPHLDNPQILAEDTTLLSFGNADTAEHRFAVWRDTYKLEYTEVGIFEENIQAYQIGKDNYSLTEDTKPIGIIEKDSKYHDFRTILRKHNIARRENAFEVLVNLFLCKLVDEEENRDNLQFYWNGPASDNYFDFVDRLQNLYQRGMRKFLNEEISYISREQIDDAFWPVKNDRNATKKQIQEYFTELKFFSNSAFSFLDTHNKDLFERNTAVLSEVVQMWQGLRLKTDDPNQFLGDMFEYFLDNSIKQSEGQFFTPLPICKFIVSSLPLAQKIEANPEPLKAIDYACGSGHFLNEYAYQLKWIDEKNEIGREVDLNDYYSEITGIEKEDRLAKVAKVAAYMHGQEQIKILDADALAAHSGIQRESYDVLVANPPFAVEGFLQTLNEEDKKEYHLTSSIGKNSNTNTIQCFFLERIRHLMASGGVVGVIVPSTILSNDDAVHTCTRELLLQFFDIVSIAELGSGTFGKTGTNTVVLFLKRKTKIPETAEHYRDRVEKFFEGDNEGEVYQDHYLIKLYCEHIEVPYEEYIKLFDQTSLDPLSNLLEFDIFKDYQQAFDKSTKIKNLKKTSIFKRKTPTERSTELDRRFITYLHKIEKEKLYYFILAHEQEIKVLVVNAPSTSKERKQFLGYEWSGRKGDEGIKYIGGDTVNDIITPLFDPKDLNNNIKINTAIKRNFIGETTDSLSEHCHYAKLTDMLNFSRIDFDKVISLNPRQQIDIINTNYEMKKLGEVVNIIRGVTYDKNEEVMGPTSNVILTADNITLEGTFEVKKQIFLNDSVELDDEKKLMAGDIFICFSSGSKKHVGKTTYIQHNTKYYAGGFMGILRNKDINSLSKYVFELLNIDMYKNIIRNTSTGSNIQNLSSTLEEIKIPLPPPEVQKQIVSKCDIVDKEADQARQTITTAEQQIEAKVQSVINAGYEIQKIDRVLTLEYGTPLPENKRVNGDFLVYGSNGVVGSHNEFSVKAPCIIVGRKGSAGEINWSDKNCTPIDTTFYVKLLNQSATDLKFIYLMLKSLNLPSLTGGSGPGGINRNNVYGLQFPMPPLDIQQQLASEVEQLEVKITEAQAVIDNATERKNAILKKYL